MSSSVQVFDKEGILKKTALIHVKDPCETADMIARKRGILEPAYTLQIDGGNSKVISCLNIFETKQPKPVTNREKKEYQEAGNRRAILMTAMDDICETRETLLPLVPGQEKGDTTLRRPQGNAGYLW